MSNYHPDRDPLTMRFARSISDTQRDPHSWWEPNIRKKKSKPFAWGAPMRGAPRGAEAELQRVLLQKEPTRDRRIDVVCWIVACVGLVWFAWALLHAPSP